MRPDPLQKFILKSEHNLRIAAGVADAWLEARNALVAGFLDRLDARLMKELKGWKSSSYEQRFFVDQYAGYWLWKPPWEGQYLIGLQTHVYGESMVFGVLREKTKIGKRPFCEELLTAVARLHPSARTNTWWEARIVMRAPAADWRAPSVLWRMHTDKTFLGDVAEQLLEVAKASERIVDQLSRKKQRRR